MPLQLERENIKSLPPVEMLALSPGGTAFMKERTTFIEPEFDAKLEWQVWSNDTKQHLVPPYAQTRIQPELDYDDPTHRKHLRLYINRSNNIVPKPSLMMIFQTSFGNNNDLRFIWPLPGLNLNYMEPEQYAMSYLVAPNQELTIDLVPTVPTYLTTIYIGTHIVVKLACDPAGNSITTPQQLREKLAEVLPDLHTAHVIDSDESGILPPMPRTQFSAIVSDPYTYDPLFLALMWKGKYINCWTKWKIRLQHSTIGTTLPMSIELPYFKHDTMSQSPTWSEEEALYNDLQPPFYVPRYWGQKPRPWESSHGALSKQPPQLYDCRRYLFGNFLLRTFLYVPEPEYTGNPWYDLAWPRWLKEKRVPPPPDTSIPARADPHEPTYLPQQQWFKGGGTFRVLPCTVDIEAEVYTNKYFKGKILGKEKVLLEIVHVRDTIIPPNPM